MEGAAAAGRRSSAVAGVLALQGGVREHRRALAAAGMRSMEVRTPSDLAQVRGLVIPGGESTAISRLASRYGLIDPLRARMEEGMGAFGTCAGMIFLAARVAEGAGPRPGVLDITVRRNAYGRQNQSFECDLDVAGWGEPLRAVFIRSPMVESVGEGVEVLAEHGGRPVLVRQGRILAAAFHPELTGDGRLHRLAADMMGEGSAKGGEA